MFDFDLNLKIVCLVNLGFILPFSHLSVVVLAIECKNTIRLKIINTTHSLLFCSARIPSAHNGFRTRPSLEGDTCEVLEFSSKDEVLSVLIDLSKS